MTDKLISDLGAIGAAIADTTVFEAQRSGQTTTEKATGTDLTTYIGSKNLSYVADKPASVVTIGASPLLFKTHVANRYYTPIFAAGGGHASVGSATRISLFPFMVPQKITISELFVRINTTNAGNWQAAVYASDASTLLWTGLPLAKSNASASTSSAGAITSALNTNIQLSPGIIYWMAFEVDNATATFTILAFTANTIAWLIGDATPGNVIASNAGLAGGYFIGGQTFGTWPDLTGVASSGIYTSTGTLPIIGYKVASVP